MKVIYSALLFILHLFADILEATFGIWVYLKYKLIPIDKCDLMSDFDEIKQCSNRLTKLPKHITILLGTEEVTFKDLSNIVMWSIALGIPFISFYDCKGTLKKTEDLFRAELESVSNHEDHIIWHNDHTNTHRNGYVGRKIHLKVLSPEDGRIQFAKVCRVLLQESRNKISDIDIKYLDAKLRECYEFPDPELGIYFGKTFSLYDYPPWQINVTEFLNIRSRRELSCRHFINVLSRYCKCEQRLGK